MLSFLFIDFDWSDLRGMKFPALLAILLGLIALAYAIFRFLAWVFRRSEWSDDRRNRHTRAMEEMRQRNYERDRTDRF